MRSEDSFAPTCEGADPKLDCVNAGKEMCKLLLIRLSMS